MMQLTRGQRVYKVGAGPAGGGSNSHVVRWLRARNSDWTCLDAGGGSFCTWLVCLDFDSSDG